MLQIITAMMKDPQDQTVCHLLFANQVTVITLIYIHKIVSAVTEDQTPRTHLDPGVQLEFGTFDLCRRLVALIKIAIYLLH